MKGEKNYENNDKNENCNEILSFSDNQTETNWINGREKCRLNNSTLIELHDTRQKIILQNFLKNNTIASVWIGLTNIEWSYLKEDSDNSHLCVSYDIDKQTYVINPNQADSVCQNGKYTGILHHR